MYESFLVTARAFIYSEIHARDPNVTLCSVYEYEANIPPLSALDDQVSILSFPEDSDTSCVECFLFPLNLNPSP